MMELSIYASLDWGEPLWKLTEQIDSNFLDSRANHLSSETAMMEERSYDLYNKTSGSLILWYI